MQALILGFCSSGYDFAIPSSRLHLAIQTLGVAIGFVGNYAPCGLSPQTNGMPVIQQKNETLSRLIFYTFSGFAGKFSSFLMLRQYTTALTSGPSTSEMGSA